MSHGSISRRAGSRLQRLKTELAVVAVVAAIGWASARAATLHRGDFVLANTATYGTCQVVVLDHTSFAPTVVSTGPLVTRPSHVAVDMRGRILVTDYDRGIVAVDPGSGSQSVLASSTALGGVPYGLTVTNDGNLFVSLINPGRILRVDPDTGEPTTVASGGLLSYPLGLTSGSDGMLYVAENRLPLRGSIVRVDPASGTESFVATSGEFVYPFDIAVRNGTAWTLQTGFADGRGGCLEETHLADATSTHSPLSAYCRSKGIAVAGDGMIAYSDCIPVDNVCSTLITGRSTDGVLLTGMGGPLGVVPEGVSPTPARTPTWGRLKLIYR